MKTLSDRNQAIALLLIVPALFTANMLIARWVQGDIPAVAMATLRWSLTFLLLLPLVGRALWAARAVVLADWRRFLVLGALGMGICGAPVYLAGQTTTATNIGLIYAASPVLIVLFGRFGWGEAVSARQMVGIGLCLLGVLAIVLKGDPTALLALEFVAGDLWIVAAMTSWAVYSVLLKHWPSPLPMLVRFAAIVLFGALVNLPIFLVEHIALQPLVPSWTVAGVVLILAIVPGLGAYIGYGRLVALAGPNTAGLVLYLAPLYTAGLAFVLLGEVPKLYHLIGAALILPGLWLGARR